MHFRLSRTIKLVRIKVSLLWSAGGECFSTMDSESSQHQCACYSSFEGAHASLQSLCALVRCICIRFPSAGWLTTDDPTHVILLTTVIVGARVTQKNAKLHENVHVRMSMGEYRWSSELKSCTDLFVLRWIVRMGSIFCQRKCNVCAVTSWVKVRLVPNVSIFSFCARLCWISDSMSHSFNATFS